MENRKFFAGLEEVFGRFGGLFVTLVLFAVYGWAKGNVSLDWFQVSGYLALFWLIYEIFSYIFFKTFRYFASTNQDESVAEEVEKVDEKLDK
jgi:hypothetical protein